MAKQIDFSTTAPYLTLFIVLFLVSVTNSIFLNQLGYYGALILLLYQWRKTRTNPFPPTNLGIYFLLFLAVELIAAFGSINQPQAFNNTLKRALLIPLVYVFAAAPSSLREIKRYIHIYLAAAVAVTILYLIASYKYVVLNLYQITESGPALFQYPITTSELLLFAIIISFSLFFHLKHEKKLRWLYLTVSCVSVLGLLATYKRTGFIGAGIGLMVVLILYNKKFILVPLAALGFLVVFSGKNFSAVTLYNISSYATVKEIISLPTSGRASASMFSASGDLYIADYEGGLLKLQNDTLYQVARTPSPAQRIYSVSDSTMFVWLADSRLTKYFYNTHSVQELRTYLSPGLTADTKVTENTLTLLDKDSGVTQIPFLDSALHIQRIQPAGANERVYVFGNSLAVIRKKGGILFYTTPKSLPILYDSSFVCTFSAEYNNRLIVSSGKDLHIYSVSTSGMNKAGIISGITHPAEYTLERKSKRLFISTLEGKIYRIDTALQNSEFLFSVPYLPRSISAYADTVALTQFKRSRLASFTDPYNPSNLSRIALWRAGLLINQDYPWFGVGDIDLGKLFKQYKREYDKEIQGHMHNNYIHFLVIIGRVGLFVMILLFSVIFVRVFRALRSVEGNDYAVAYMRGFIGSFAAFLTAGLTEWNFGDHEIITMVWFTLGLVFAFERIAKTGKKISV